MNTSTATTKLLPVLAGGLALGLSFPAPAHANPNAAQFADGSLADVAERVVDSVVNISIAKSIEIDQTGFDGWFLDDPDSPFYIDPKDRKQRGQGSGVIITAQGRILTNAHVVNGADEIVVTLPDGSEQDAKVVGVDTRSDLAVVQLQGKVSALKPLAFGDSTKLRLGEVVLAIGNPMGIGQSVSMGIVSAKGRGDMGIVDYEDFIQTDAAINPGNSGGALVNMKGELIGINTAILSRSGTSAGIGFAVPSHMARPISEMLVRNGKVTRGYLGVNIATVNKATIKEFGLQAQHGAVITAVEAGGPAAKAGIKANDVVLTLDGAPIRDARTLRNTIAMRGAGKTSELAIQRGKDPKTIKVVLGELPEPTRKPIKPAVKRRTR
jgi:Do/DeqQ family serine protease